MKVNNENVQSCGKLKHVCEMKIYIDNKNQARMLIGMGDTPNKFKF